MFVLILDNFGIKYVGKEHFSHLISAIKNFIQKNLLMNKENYSVALNYMGL